MKCNILCGWNWNSYAKATKWKPFSYAWCVWVAGLMLCKSGWYMLWVFSLENKLYDVEMDGKIWNEKFIFSRLPGTWLALGT